MQAKVLLSVAILAITATLADAARVTVPASEDATVTQVKGDMPRGSNEILFVGVTQSPERGLSRGYFKFPLGALGQSGLLSQTVIERATLRLFAQSTGMVSDGSFLVTVSDCVGAWDEAAITWNNQPCLDTGFGVDTRVLDREAFPDVFEWDVTQSVAEAFAEQRPELTLIVDARWFDVQVGTRDIINDNDRGGRGRGRGTSEASLEAGFVRFWSREREEFGASVMPTVAIEYSTEPTATSNAATIFVSVLTAIALALGVYQGLRELKKSR